MELTTDLAQTICHLLAISNPQKNSLHRLTWSILKIQFQWKSVFLCGKPINKIWFVYVVGAIFLLMLLNIGVFGYPLSENSHAARKIIAFAPKFEICTIIPKLSGLAKFGNRDTILVRKNFRCCFFSGSFLGSLQTFWWKNHQNRPWSNNYISFWSQKRENSGQFWRSLYM